jgi:hypothetical protein
MEVDIFIPPEMNFAIPRAKTIMARVAMKGWMRNREIAPPEMIPRKAPRAMQAGMENHGLQSLWMDSMAKRTEENPRILPTERSMPAVIITSVIPQARIP